MTRDRSKDCVILIHGLGRTARSMAGLKSALEKDGYTVKNMSYPSRKYPVDVLVDNFVKPVVFACGQIGKIHFVTHSLGGILVRVFLASNHLPTLGKVVLIAPPNKGSELVDKFRNNRFYKWWLGPAFLQLSTDRNSIPNRLPAPDYPVGIIAGTKSLNPLFSKHISGENDGKVSVESASIPGVPIKKINASHTWITCDKDAIRHSCHFLECGRFI